MEENNPLQSLNPVFQSLLQLFSLIGLYLLFAILFGVLGIQLTPLLTGIEIKQDVSELDFNTLDQATIFGYKIFQGIASIGTFIVTALVFARYFAKEKISTFFGFKRAVPNAKVFGLTVLIALLSIPVISLLISLNQQIPLPDSLAEDAVSLQATNDSFNKAFLQAPTIGVLLINLLIIAIIPALGEELLFRGTFMQLFYRFFKEKIHLAIIVVAILFSVMHLQYNNFLAIMFMGVLFGYLYYWSGNIMVAIGAHFLNNGTAVVLAYLQQQYPNEPFFSYDYEFPIYTSLLSAVALAGAVWLFYKATQNNHPTVVEVNIEDE